MVTLSSDTRPIIGRGPPLLARFFFLGVLSVTVMALDHRGGYLDTARVWLGLAANPLYSVVEAPFRMWGWLTESFADRSQLRTDNARLSEDLRAARIKLLQFESLNEENQRLRAIRSASQGIAERTLIAGIIHVDVDPFRHRVRINKGASDGVYKRQPILDAFGIVGQVVQVDRYTSELILISDAEHAIPVQVNRNGIRSIAVGTGSVDRLSLPYLTVEADVKADDLLVSSGLDGIFPRGYPVARVSKVVRDPAQTFAVVEAKPLAQLDRDREVLLLWFDKPVIEPEKVTPAEKPAPTASTSAKPALTVPAPAKPGSTTPPPKPAPTAATSPKPGSTSAAPTTTPAKPPRTSAPRTETATPPAEASTPPAEASTPVETSAPPAETATPPAETSTPPLETAAPVTETPTPPPPQ